MTEGKEAGSGWLGRITGALAAASAKNKWIVFALALALVAASAVGALRHLSIDTDSLDMISAETPFRKANLAFRAAFPWYGDQIAVVIDAPTPELAEQEARRLLQLMQARPEMFRSPQAPGIDPFLRRNGLLFMPLERLQDLLDQLAGVQAPLAALAERPDLTGLLDMLSLALSEADAEAPQTQRLTALLTTLNDMAAHRDGAPDILSWRRQLAVDGQQGLSGRQILIARPVQNYGSLSPAKSSMAELRRLFADAPDVSGGLVHRITGNAALNTEELQSVRLGGSTAGVLSGIGILVLLIWGLRGVRPVLATLVVLIAGLVISLGFATVAVGRLNLLSVAFAVLFIGLAVDFSIHFALRVREAGGGLDGVRGAAQGVGPAIALSAAAASVGFLSFLPTDYRGLSELGIIAGGSMLVALTLNLTLLPALLAGGVGGAGSAPASRARGESRLARLFRERAGKGRLGVMLPPLACILLFAVCLSAIRFDSDPVNLKDPESESVAAWRDLADDPARGVSTIDGLVAPGTDLDALTRDLQAASHGGQVVHIDRFTPADQQQKLAALEAAALFMFPVLLAEAQPPPTSAARRRAVSDFAQAAVAAKPSALAGAAQELARALQGFDDAALAGFERRATVTLPLWLDDLRTGFEATPITRATMPDAFRRLWVAPDGRLRVQVRPGEDFSESWRMGDYARDVAAVMPSATGAPVMVSFAGRTIMDSFFEASALAGFLVLLLLAAALRRLSSVLLTAAPVALAAAMSFALIPLLGLQLNFANVIVLPLLFGLGVASAIQVVARRDKAGGAAAMLRSSTPRAVMFSVLTTLASFGGLALAPHRGMASMGVLLTIAILNILFWTLIWLPTLLLWLERREGRK